MSSTQTPTEDGVAGPVAALAEQVASLTKPLAAPDYRPSDAVSAVPKHALDVDPTTADHERAPRRRRSVRPLQVAIVVVG